MIHSTLHHSTWFTIMQQHTTLNHDPHNIIQDKAFTRSVFYSPPTKLFVIYRTTPWSPHKNSRYLHVLKWILYGIYYYGTMNDTVFQSMFRIWYFQPNLTFHAKTVKICSFFINSSTFAMKIRPRKSVIYYILYLHRTSFLLDNVLSFRVGSSFVRDNFEVGSGINPLGSTTLGTCSTDYNWSQDPGPNVNVSKEWTYE
jgi:hypothetical protein